MKTSQFVVWAFAILSDVNGLPSSDASTRSSLQKRGLLYPLKDYEHCLDNEFKDSFNRITPWGGVKCKKHKQIKFYADQATTFWRSGKECYEKAKEGLREEIKKGNSQASKRISHGLATCELGVKTMPYPTEDYVDCLEKEVKTSMFDNKKWDDVTCPNSKIKFEIHHTWWNSAKGCYSAIAEDLKDKIFNGNPDAYMETNKVLANCNMRVRTEE